MARSWCDEANGAVQVLAVIPRGKGFHPSLGVLFGCKPFVRPVRAIFAGAEQRLRERIVIADARSAVGCDDAKLFHSGFHRRTLHWAAVIGMQNQWAQGAFLSQNRLADQHRRQLCGLAFMNFPSHDLAAEDAHDQVELKNMPAMGPGSQVISQVQTSQGPLAL